MEKIQKTFSALGTVNSIMISYDKSMEFKVKATTEQIKMRVLELDDRLSVFKATSEISQINAAAGENFVEVKTDTYHIIRKAVQYAELSMGAFDITTRPLSKLWGIGKKGDYIPSEGEIKEAMNLVNYKDIIYDEKPYRIKLRKKGQAIDLGGIAKGYAADEAKRILLENNIIDAVINFGGIIIVLGKEKKVGIQNPEKKTGTPMGTLRVKNQAVVTSGWYERFFMKEEKRYHHILNPHTGMPSDSGVCSITVVGNSAMELDAISTAVFVLGTKIGARILNKCKAEGIFVLKSHDVLMTQELTDKFSFIKKQEVSKCEERASSHYGRTPE